MRFYNIILLFNSFIHAGKIGQAASVLGKSKEEESLGLAAEVAKLVGQTTFANHIEAKKKDAIKLKQEIEKNNEKPEEIQALPTRVEIMLNDVPYQLDSESCIVSEKDTKNDIAPNLDVEDSGAGPSGINKQDNERNKNADERESLKTTNNGKNDKGDETATDVDKDTNNETNECLNHSATDVNVAKDDENKVRVLVKYLNEDEDINGKEASDKDKTDELLEELPSKMKDLMTGNMYQNGNVQNGKANENRTSAIKDASDLNDNVNEKGDHVTVTDADN